MYLFCKKGKDGVLALLHFIVDISRHANARCSVTWEEEGDTVKLRRIRGDITANVKFQGRRGKMCRSWHLGPRSTQLNIQQFS